MKTSAPSHASIEDEAADWLVRRNAGLTPVGEAEFQRWRTADRRNARAFAEFETVWRTLNQPRADGQAGGLASALAARMNRRARRRNAGVAAAVGLAAMVAIVFSLRPTVSRTSATRAPSTVVARPDRVVLPDGSVVELNAGAEIAVDYSPRIRGVRLLSGEALFSVAKDAAHPFVVTAGGVEVRAVGTAFAVRHATNQIDVLVTEGRVAVARVGGVAAAGAKPDATAATEPVYLPAGGRLIVPVGPSVDTAWRLEPFTREQSAAALAWRARRVEFTGTTLADAVELFNRQNRVQLSVADAALAELQLSGIFWCDDPDGFVRLLESGMNVRAERSPGVIVLRRQ